MSNVRQKENRVFYIYSSEISDLQHYLSMKKTCYLILNISVFSNNSQSFQKISGPDPDQSNLIELLIYFAVSPTDPYKVAGYNHF